MINQQSNMQYEETGKQIQLYAQDLQDIQQYVFKQLQDFDAGRIENNPYVNPIPFQTSSGQMLYVPKDMQLNIIQEYNKIHDGNNQSNSMLATSTMHKPINGHTNLFDKNKQTNSRSEKYKYILIGIIMASIFFYVINKQ